MGNPSNEKKIQRITTLYKMEHNIIVITVSFFKLDTRPTHSDIVFPYYS